MILFFESLLKNKTLSFSFFLIASLYFYSGIFFGLDFTDSFYHLNQAIDPANNIYLYPFFLSSLIIKWFVEIAGPEIIYLRTINSSLLYLSFLLPFFINKVSILRAKNLYLISTILILFAPFNVNILGYDSLSIFILSVIFSVTILYFQKARSSILILLSLLSAAAVLIRIPNVLVVPILLMAVGLNNRIRYGSFSRKIFKRLLIFLLLTILWVYLGYFWYYPGIEEFIQASANATSHDLKNLLRSYLTDAVQIISLILFFLTCFYLMKKFKHRISDVLLFGFIGFFIFLFIAVFIAFTKYSQKYSFLLTALAITITVIQLFNKDRNELFGFKKLILFLFLLFIFINPFGSNTGLLKAVSLISLLPFVLSSVNFKINSYWFLILLIIIPFSFLENIYKTYEDQGILYLDHSPQIKFLFPIQTSAVRSEFLEKVDHEVKHLKKNNIKVFFYGDKSHIFHYLYPETVLNINSFFQPLNDLTYYPLVEQVINEHEKVAIFLISSYPGRESNSQSVLGTELVNDGFKQVTTESLIYYIRI